MAKKVQSENQSTMLYMRVRGMVILLAVQYALGMFLSMFGGLDDPEKMPLYGRISLISHVIFAIMLLIGSIFILIAGLKHETWKKPAIYGFVSILLAIIGGVGFLVLKGTGADILSYVMSIGFIAAFACYGYLFFLIRKINK